MALRKDKTFEETLAAAQQALEILGTRAFKSSEIIREGPRSYKPGRLGRLTNLDQKKKWRSGRP